MDVSISACFIDRMHTTKALKIIIILLLALTCFVSSASNAFIIVEDNISGIVLNQTNSTNLKHALVTMRSSSKLIISAGDNYTLSYDDVMTMYGMNSIVIVGGALITL